jgi:hypothetical protein
MAREPAYLAELRAPIVLTPEDHAAVADWPEFTPAKIAELRRLLYDLPAFIEKRVLARHPELREAG